MSPIDVASPADQSWAIVLGATGGIGMAFCHELARNGVHLILCARSNEKLFGLMTELRSKYSIHVESQVVDLCNRKDVETVIDLLQINKSLSWMVNATGRVNWGRFHENKIEDELATIELNVLVPLELAHAAIRAFQAKGEGNLIHVSSFASFVSQPYLAAYCASKSAMTQFLSSIHVELRGSGLRVQALCPGFVRTGIFDTVGADTRRFPRWIWLSPAFVARASLVALKKNHPICIPGFRYRCLAALLRLTPTSINNRVSGAIFGNFEKYRLRSSFLSSSSTQSHRVR